MEGTLAFAHVTPLTRACAREGLAQREVSALVVETGATSVHTVFAHEAEER